ncbi:DUF339 domain-containing protein [Verticillium alfalfae VaMs.102]|uniref:Probable endonuclease LCL3 n=1 Tax=Verticillium alfalfae (strain VaMs.102 / ATCC MYA-4576 / FGSC 10136) TaxID=526221 RepID=LCL3_VERA1|nr:DUF339 domain-containing protein [Verticillium alfalfae VaMs.102]C9SI22.1 RecName: Full=Probable endonuclease LCL3 [Verticillium alfalfae VaMs.102]EEY18595.1 DUF339 domain-containing protein [Verticillium alfalfae VaMs.102]
MPWPFGPSGSSEAPPPQKPRDDKVEGREPAKSWNSLLPKPDPPLQAAKEWAPVFLTAVGSLAAFMFYQSYLRRFAGAASIQENFFRKRSLLGRVTSVGDGDGFHLYHTPGGKLAGWGWLRKIPEGRSNLKGETISIRLAGIDAPEGPHFGRPGQPFAAEAQAHLSKYILHRRVRAHLHKRDQYNRIVATVSTRQPFIKKDVGLEMLKQGLATTYEAKSGVEWGGKESIYKAAEAKAKAKKLGLWSIKASEFESPRDFKNRTQGNEKSERDVEGSTVQKPWWRRWLTG